MNAGDMADAYGMGMGEFLEAFFGCGLEQSEDGAE